MPDELVRCNHAGHILCGFCGCEEPHERRMIHKLHCNIMCVETGMCNYVRERVHCIPVTEGEEAEHE